MPKMVRARTLDHKIKNLQAACGTTKLTKKHTTTRLL
jgi:hypothetical protein